jgi:hypothetical protein
MTLLERLKRKYTNNPAAAAAALGLDSAAMLRRVRAAAGDEGEGGGDAIRRILALIRELDDDQFSDLMERLSEDVEVGVAEDDPPPFSGRPRPGGGMDPVAPRARDLLRQRPRSPALDALALDALDRHINARERADADAARRYPNASRIRRHG